MHARSAGTLALKGAPQVARLLEDALPPETGPLPPVREGWLLRRVEGAEPWNLVPARVRMLALILAVCPPVAIDLMSFSLGGPTGLSFFGFIIAWRWSRPIADALLRMGFERRAAVDDLRGRHAGEVVRIKGRVRPGSSFASAGGGWPAVMAGYAGTVTYELAVEGEEDSRVDVPRLWAEVRGIDFVVDLPSGDSVLVEVRGSYMLAPREVLKDMLQARTWDEAPAPLRRVVRRSPEGAVTEAVSLELLVEPNDEVEVLGVLDFDASPLLPGGPARGAGIGPVVRGDARRPLVVRPREPRCDA